MNYDEQFEDIYIRIVEDNKDYIGNSHKEAKKENFIDNKILGSIALICFIVFFVANNKAIQIISAIICAIVGLYIFSKSKKGKSKIEKYEIDYREKIIGDLVRYIEPKLYYSTEKNIEKNVYDSVGYEEYEYFESQDLISGDVDYKHIEMSKIHTWDEIHMKDSNSRKLLNLFYGLFTKIDLQKDFEDTIIIRKKANNLYKKVLDLIDRYELRNIRIQAQNDKFDNYFEIYSRNEEYANRIINMDMQEKLVNLYYEMDAMQAPFDITFKDNSVYIRIFDDKIFNSPALENNSLDKEVIYRYYKILTKNMDLIKLISSVKA